MVRKIILSCWVLLSLSATAKVIHTPLGSVDLVVPNGWKAMKGFMGVPLTLLGPKSEGDRPAIYVIPLGKSGTLVDENKFNHSEADYRNGIRHWAKESKSQVKKFFPHQKMKWKNTDAVHRFGVNYVTNKTEYVEFTHYVTCKNRLYNVKTILSRHHLAPYQSKVNEVLQDFRCK